MTDTIEQLKTEQAKGKSIESILQEQRENYLESIPHKGKVSVIACIPAYNEERSIASVILRTREYVDNIIVCDDGSTDLTAEIAEGLGAVVLKHEVNQGKGATIRSLMREALKHNPKYIVLLDGDGQHNPDEIPSLVLPLDMGEADMVIGSRYIDGDNEDAPFYRKIGLGIIDRVFKNSINEDVQDSQSGYRAYTVDAVNHLVESKSNGFGVETEQISIATTKGLRIKEVPVHIQYKGLGKTSKKNPFTHGAEIISSILNLVITERPLLLLGVPGLASLVIGVISLGFFYYYHNLTGYDSVPFAILSVSGIIVGPMLILVSMILYAINKINLNGH